MTVDFPPDPITGKRRRGTETYRTRKEAESREREWMLEIERGAVLDGGKMTFGEYLTYWLNTYAKHNVRLSTYTSYTAFSKNHIIPALGAIMLRKLSPTHIQDFYQAKLTGGRLDKKEGNLAPRTVRYFHSIIREALQHAFEQNLVPRNVADAVKPPKGARPSIKVWNEEEARIFLRGTEDALYAPLWLILLATGVRRGEALGLRWKDVDLKKGTISIRQTLVDVNGHISFGEPKTKHGRRTIDLDPGCIAALTAHRDAQTFRRKAMGDGWRDLDLVFTTAEGNWIRPRNVDRKFYGLVQETGLPHIPLHGLRHTCATLLLLHNVNPKIVSERLGHANVSITLDTYSHVLPTMQKQAAAAIGAALFG